MIRIFQKIFYAIFTKQDDDQFSDFLINNSAKLFFVQSFSVFLSFLLNYVLVKGINLKEYGSYVYVLNLLSLLVNFCLLGLDTLLVKNVSIYYSARKYGELKGIIFFSIGFVAISSAIIAMFSTKAIPFISNVDVGAYSNWAVLSFSFFLVFSIALLYQSILQGLKKIFLSQITEKILKPVLLLIIVVFFLYAKQGITVEKLIWFNIITLTVSLLTIFVFFKAGTVFIPGKIKAKYDFSGWTNSAMAFFIMSVLYILNSKADIFLLGLLKGNEVVGVYNIVLRISEIIGFVLGIINFILAPFIARMFENGELVQLQKLITRSAQAVLVISFPLIIIIIVFRAQILGFFGVDFFNAQQALLILCLGQFFNVACGSVGLLLLMTGNQRYSIFSLIVGVIFNIVLNIILVPEYGIVGTAIATASSLIIWNFLMYFFVRRKLKIRTTAFEVF